MSSYNFSLHKMSLWSQGMLHNFQSTDVMCSAGSYFGEAEECSHNNYFSLRSQYSLHVHRHMHMHMFSVYFLKVFVKFMENAFGFI